ncbi:MAG: glycosyltransferase family 4 protein [bacterium]|nr:glycosyltransferase family 4 protein [bacterium]
MVKKLHVCFVTEDFYPEFIGGQGVYGFHLVTELARQGNHVTVLAETRKEREIYWHNKKNIQVFLTPFCFVNQLLLAFVEYVLFLLKVRKTTVDILHANQLSGLFFVLFRPKNVKTIIVSAHNTNYDMAQKTDSKMKRLLYQPLIFLERIVYTKADGLVFNSPEEQKALQRYYHIKDTPMRSIYPGVIMPEYSMKDKAEASEKVRESLGLKKDSKIVLYIGRLVKRKNVDTILKALGELQHTHTVGIIIGRGRERENLEKIASGNVIFLGYVDDTRQYSLAADVFVTVSEAEGGFSLSVLEAASYGLPLIVSPSVAGFPIVKEGKNGYIVGAEDITQLENRIRECLSNSVRMGEYSRSLAKTFSWQRTGSETASFYRLFVSRWSSSTR